MKQRLKGKSISANLIDNVQKYYKFKSVQLISFLPARQHWANVVGMGFEMLCL